MTGPSVTARCRATRPAAALARGLGDEREELAVDARDGRHRHREPGFRAPDHLRAHELRRSECRRWPTSGSLRQHRLRRVVHRGETKLMRLGRDGLPAVVDEPHRQADPEPRRLLHRHVQVDLEAGVRRRWSSAASSCVTRSPSRTGMSPTMPRGRRRDAVVGQLGAQLHESARPPCAAAPRPPSARWRRGRRPAGWRRRRRAASWRASACWRA